MQLECKKYLYDIAKACDRLAEFTAGKTFPDYAGGALLRSGVERQFEIIGEAPAQLIKRDPSFSERITETRRIIAFRNILIHGYAVVSNDVVWGILESDLPRLRHEVKALLAAGGS